MIASTHDLTVAPVDQSSEDGSSYLGGSRGRAVETLTQAILDQEVLVLLTGAAGVGKTVVLNAALAVLADAATRVIRLSTSNDQAWDQRALARAILGSAVEDPPTPEAEVAADPSMQRDLSAASEERTAAAADEARVVIAVDDAHLLTDDAIELLLKLASPVRGGERPPQLVLSGRGDFWERDRLGELLVIPRLAERVTLDAFAGRDAMDYVAFRLRRQSGSNLAIQSDALSEILHYSGGLPARIDRVLAPADSIRVCRGSSVLTGDMVEAAIATMVSVPGTPLSGPVEMMIGGEQPPPSDFVPPPQQVYLSPLTPDSVSPETATEDATSDLVSAPLDPESPIPSVRMFRSLSSRSEPANENTEVPFQVDNQETAPDASVIRDTVPAKRRLGRAASAAASFVITIGSLAGAISVPSDLLANAVVWPWSSEANSEVHADRLSIASATVQPAANRAAVPEMREITWRTEATPSLRAPATDGIGRPSPETGSPPLTSPDTESPVAAPVTASHSDGLLADRTTETWAPQTSRQPAGPPPAASPDAAALSPQMLTFLLERGNSMLQQGDVRSARLYFEQAARAGSQQGAIGAAKTYDPSVLATIGPTGLKSDVARAIEWYRVAFNTFGDQYASERLKALTTSTNK